MQPAILGPQTYQFAVWTAGPLIEFSLSLGMTAASAFSARQSAPNTADLKQACELAGSMSIELLDRDASGQLSSGDRIVLRFSGCTTGGLVTDAVLNTDVLSIATGAAQTRTALRMTIEHLAMSAGARTTHASGTIDVDWTITPATDHFRISGSRVTLSEGSDVDAIERFAYDLLQD